MSAVATGQRSSGEENEAQTVAFYRGVMEILQREGVPFLVGGAFAFAHCTGIQRNTKDLDLFIRRRDYERAQQALQGAGWRTEMAFAHWLAKVYGAAGSFVDLIFNSGNGLLPVDDDWFAHATTAQVLGLPATLAPVEESLCSKAFIMERERYDGADVAHLLRAQAARLDWARLRRRFGAHWRVLLSHLVLFGFIYPDERDKLPAWLLDELLAQLRHERTQPSPSRGVCAGTLLSREQYLPDLEQGGLLDGRVEPFGRMTRQDVADWTRAIAETREPPPEDA
ncbi:MAG TPA: nucleotidyltransferase [Albitalea sp.]|nr:nucleotidyltransferase [Albitalea sp.]